MPVLKLGDHVMPSPNLMHQLLHAAAPHASLKPIGEGGISAARDGQHTVAMVNRKTGESKVFPLVESLKSGQNLVEHAKAVAAKFAADQSFFPKDDTRITALAPLSLLKSVHTPGAVALPASHVLSYVRFQRQVGGLRIYGPGTRAMIGVGSDANIHALSHRWKKALTTSEKVKPAGTGVIAEAILSQLEPSAKTADVRVDRVRLCYYDSGQQFIQPAYRFEATILSPNRAARKQLPANRHIFGYVPIGIGPEPIPTLGTRKGKAPVAAKSDRRATPAPKALEPGDPTVGRYVVRNDSDEWYISADEFMDSLNNASAWGGGIPFTDSQYFWAEPRLFTTEKDWFVNSVQLALTEVHGNYWYFTTRDNADDGVSLSSIPASGYGGTTQALAYWILHSCEVIPTQTDESTSFDVWWNIFNGLHAAVGYRTEMWIDDDVMGPFGFAIGVGAPFVPAWLNEVVSNDSYDDGDTYFDGNRNMTEPMGRASAIAVTGHGNDPVNDVTALGRAQSLTEWWFDN
jgi:hypothetical protein